ncbi:MAG TPA: response regulator [Magnetovibrio sp.]
MADILIIEDDAAIRALVGVHLEKAGHRVTEAENGQVGVDMAQADVPDLILLDINMPVMDGTRVMKALRSADATRTVPVIALSAVSMPEMRDDMHQLGCNAYVSKPIQFDLLMGHIDKLAGKHS